MTNRPKKTGTSDKRTWREHWRLMDAWSIQALAALCCGEDPDLYEAQDQDAYERAFAMVTGGVRAHVLPTIRATRPSDTDLAFRPSDVIPWAAEKYPDTFPYVADKKPLDPRERATLHVIIAALAQRAKLDLNEQKAVDAVVAEVRAIEPRDPKTISKHPKAVARDWTRLRL